MLQKIQKPGKVNRAVNHIKHIFNLARPRPKLAPSREFTREPALMINLSEELPMWSDGHKKGVIPPEASYQTMEPAAEVSMYKQATTPFVGRFREDGLERRFIFSHQFPVAIPPQVVAKTTPAPTFQGAVVYKPPCAFTSFSNVGHPNAVKATASLLFEAILQRHSKSLQHHTNIVYQDFAGSGAAKDTTTESLKHSSQVLKVIRRDYVRSRENQSAVCRRKHVQSGQDIRPSTQFVCENARPIAPGNVTLGEGLWLSGRSMRNYATSLAPQRKQQLGCEARREGRSTVKEHVPVFRCTGNSCDALTTRSPVVVRVAKPLETNNVDLSSMAVHRTNVSPTVPPYPRDAYSRARLGKRSPTKLTPRVAPSTHSPFAVVSRPAGDTKASSNIHIKRQRDILLEQHAFHDVDWDENRASPVPDCGGPPMATANVDITQRRRKEKRKGVIVIKPKSSFRTARA